MLMSVMQLLLGLNFMGLSFLALAGGELHNPKISTAGFAKVFPLCNRIGPVGWRKHAVFGSFMACNLQLNRWRLGNHDFGSRITVEDRSKRFMAFDASSHNYWYFSVGYSDFGHNLI